MINRYLPLTVVLLLVILYAVQPARAEDQTNQEDELLSMFFDEDELVETATRSPKPIYQVAEDVTIITAQEIEEMHAHTLAEVLQRQPGVFIGFFGQDFLGDSSVQLLGTERHHVLVLLDGVRLNLGSSGYAITNFIPLGIIKRIEIIKGAASSTWGSALGGVINIITKDVGETSRPTGRVEASYGEGNSRDISADVAGKVGGLGYYLYGGNIDSDGLRLDRYSQRNSAYGKIELKLPHSSNLTVSAGYSDPHYKNLDWEDAWGVTDLNIYEDVAHENIWGTIYFDSDLTQKLGLHISVQHFENDYLISRRSSGNGLGGSYGDLIFGEEWEDESNSFVSRLTWSGKSVTANIGYEASRSEMTYGSELGTLFGGPTSSEDDPVTEKRHGLYGNLTYVNGKFTVTPGLRYDYHSNSEESVNPSLGLTYLLTGDILFRGFVAKGFSAPYLSATANFNDLQPENTWTYQAGIETAAIPYIQLKATLFHQDIEDAWTYDVIPWENSGNIRLNGFEIEAETESYYGLSLVGNFTFVTSDSTFDGITVWEDDETYAGNLIVAYRNIDYGLRAEVAGNYYLMSDREKNKDPEDGSFIWDFLIAKDFSLSALNGEIFLKGRNIFNGDRYFDIRYPNPERWFEVGLTIVF